MSKVRFLFALWASKLSIPVMRLTGHNATNYPGQIAINICPDFLKYIGKPEHIISVTGTNGKTTVNNMIADMFEASGKKILSNRAGSNTRTGITTALIKGANLAGKAKFDTAVFETDERALLSSAASFLSEETGLPVEVYGADDEGLYDPQGKAKAASPGRPAILLE